MHLNPVKLSFKKIIYFNILALLRTSTRYYFPQLTFLEFHFETEVKVDFPSACI